MEKKFVIVAGGVMSGVGKGVAAASIGKILQEYGYKTTAIKIDPYINVDAGTLRPTEHGEVWVTSDGGEIDQDLGNYERFLGQQIPKKNNITTGQIYKTIIEKERNGEFLGKTVQFIPHIPNEIKRRILDASEDFEVTIIEVGGTVGDHENIPFLFAIKSLEREFGEGNFVYILLTYLPIPSHINEMKTKPTQTAIHLLTESGIFPDIILCRAKEPLDDVRKEKIETAANIKKDFVISAPDIKSIYDVPINFEKDKIGSIILKAFHLRSNTNGNSLKEWKDFIRKRDKAKKELQVAVVGKYFDTGDFVLSDAYVSVIEAVKFSSYWNEASTKLTWINSKEYEIDPKKISELKKYDGIIVPGGFGESGIEGIIMAIKYARENKIPYLGICYGMQLAVIEFARNVVGWSDAHTAEINSESSHLVIDIMPEQKKLLAEEKYGATMRLGAYPAILKKNTIAYNAYDREEIFERHRHRYEVNPEYIEEIEKNGMIFSGTSPSGKLQEIIELPKSVHPFFLGTQFHPEFKARPLHPHPLFTAFIKACLKNK